jgi:hypothetical protein
MVVVKILMKLSHTASLYAAIGDTTKVIKSLKESDCQGRMNYTGSLLIITQYPGYILSVWPSEKTSRIVKWLGTNYQQHTASHF